MDNRKDDKYYFDKVITDIQFILTTQKILPKAN